MLINRPTIRAGMIELHTAMKDRSVRIKPTRWQSVDVSNNPAAEMHELRWVHLHLPLGSREVSYYQQAIVPDLPWADEHFAERVSGIPYNPQPSEARWPHGDGINRAFKNEGELHSHTYSERFWPRYAGGEERRGIRYRYGDLHDVASMLAIEPDTRQAVLPVWFPEDTGAAHVGRKPCTLHYHFYRRGNFLDVEYSIRSCDYRRHFRNDVYLTIRLLLWMIDQCQQIEPERWANVAPGLMIMNIGSLHLFRNDYLSLWGDVR